MTLSEIQALVVSVDPTAGHYDSAHKGRAFTRWMEYRQLDRTADDAHAEAWAFQIDRFAKSEGDAVAEAFRAALDADPRVSYRYEVSYEDDTGYIHHIFDCEGY